MAGVKPEDIDVCELHDCFSIASIIAAESLGFSEFGKAGELWEKGETKIGGKIPINISGGLKSKGHPIGATGASQVYEITRQLRGELVDQGRQVEGAKVGLVDTFTTTYVAAEGKEAEVPYTIVMIELDEGAWIAGNLIDIDPSEASMDLIGKRVKLGHKLFPGDRFSGGETARPLFSFDK